jgi:hypothetical protein
MESEELRRARQVLRIAEDKYVCLSGTDQEHEAHQELQDAQHEVTLTEAKENDRG